MLSILRVRFPCAKVPPKDFALPSNLHLLPTPLCEAKRLQGADGLNSHSLTLLRDKPTKKEVFQ